MRTLLILTLIALSSTGLAESGYKVGTFIEAPTHSFVLSTPTGQENNKAYNERVQYNPTFSRVVGAQAKFGNTEFSYKKHLPGDTDADRFGRSTFEDFRTRFVLSDRFRVAAFHQNYSSFYADLSGRKGLQSSYETNTDDPDDPDRDIEPIDYEDPIVKREDITIKWTGGEFAYHWSFVDAMNRITPPGEPKIPDGFEFDWVFVAKYSVLNIHGSQSLVPEPLHGNLSDIAELTDINAVTTMGGTGLHTDWGGESGRFFLTGTAGAGRQVQTLSDTTDETPSVETRPITYLDFTMGFGFGIGIGDLDFQVSANTLSSSLKSQRLTSKRLSATAMYSVAFGP